MYDLSYTLYRHSHCDVLLTVERLIMIAVEEQVYGNATRGRSFSHYHSAVLLQGHIMDAHSCVQSVRKCSEVRLSEPSPFVVLMFRVASQRQHIPLAHCLQGHTA